MIVVALYLAAFIVALVDEAIAHGKSILGYAVLLVCLGLLWGKL